MRTKIEGAEEHANMAQRIADSIGLHANDARNAADAAEQRAVTAEQRAVAAQSNANAAKAKQELIGTGATKC